MPPRTAVALPLAGFGGSPQFVFLGERLWLDFVNTDAVQRGGRVDLLRDFEGYVRWMHAANVFDTERSAGFLRRAQEQPAGAGAALLDARRVRSTLRALAERGSSLERTRHDALGEINRVLGRSAGTRRVETRDDGSYVRSFVPVGDAYAGLLIPIVESAADSMIQGELLRVRRCADPRCAHVFFDATRNGKRRWCDMTLCGNRAKAARHRARAAGRELASLPRRGSMGVMLPLSAEMREESERAPLTVFRA